MSQLQKFIGCTALWTVAVLLMTVQTVQGGETYLGQWAILSALGACVFTGWLIVEDVTTRERLRMEHLAEIMARASADETRDLPRIR